MIDFFRDFWYTRCRRIDLDVLWPICKANAPDLDHARAAFAVHAYHDPAWLWLGERHIAMVIGVLGINDDS